MYITYRKNTNEVVFYSEGKNQIDNPNLDIIEINPTIDELDKINKGYIIKYVKGKLLFEKNWKIINQEKKDNIIITKDKIVKAKTINDLKEIINKLIE